MVMDILPILALVVLAIALGAQSAWLVTRNYYKTKDREREHNHERQLLHEVIRMLGGGDGGPRGRRLP
jgi:hypothetical protein